MRLRTILLATTLCFSINSAFGQAGVAGEGGRKPDTVPSAVKPVKRAVASFWTSPEPTFDEGTYNRINTSYNTGANQLVKTITANFGIPIKFAVGGSMTMRRACWPDGGGTDARNGHNIVRW